MKGFWDYDFESHVMCQQLISAHEEQFKTLLIKEEFTIPGFERTPTSTLADLLKFGADPENETAAGPIIYYLRRALTYITE